MIWALIDCLIGECMKEGPNIIISNSYGIKLNLSSLFYIDIGVLWIPITRLLSKIVAIAIKSGGVEIVNYASKMIWFGILSKQSLDILSNILILWCLFCRIT